MKRRYRYKSKKSKRDKTRERRYRDESRKARNSCKSEAKNNMESSVLPVPLSTDIKENNNELPTEPLITDFDVLRIYSDISKLGAIERYLNILYRPFTCFVRTRCEYNLSELNSFLSNTRYEPEKHSALFVRLSSPVCSLKVYANGNICCQGYSYDGAALGIHRFIGTMEHTGYSPIFSNPKFNVVTATFCLPFAIDLDRLYVEFTEDCLYNRETRPYLTYKIRDSSIKLAIFPMGYVYVLLSSQPRCTQKAIALIMPILYRHRTAHSPNGAETELSSGDINFKLLWENEFQSAYQGSLKYTK